MLFMNKSRFLKPQPAAAAHDAYLAHHERYLLKPLVRICSPRKKFQP